MRLLLLRHAVTAETGSRLTGRQAGVGLSQTGKDMAGELGEWMDGIPLAAIYTSPIRRCRETARIVADRFDLSPISYRSFAEVDYGSWTGRSLGSLRRTKLWKQLFVAPSRVRFPGGESLAEVQTRAVAAAEDLAARHAGQVIAVVSHADVIKTILAHYLGMPLDLFQRLHVAPASRSVVELPAEGTAHVLAVNELAGAGRWR